MVVHFPILWLVDPNAVKDAPRPVRDDFRYSEPYRFRITEEMLDGYPEEYKRVFGLDTMSQDDINRVIYCIHSKD